MKFYVRFIVLVFALLLIIPCDVSAQQCSGGSCSVSIRPAAGKRLPKRARIERGPRGRFLRARSCEW
jgi:hypothetical protein